MDPADPDVRVVRLAVVMTGGVSLAVWIGGVVAEIYRAVRGAGIYGALCRETRSLVAVDVITGASAGGVNGAFLSAALAYGLDEQAFDGLRDVWLRDGGFDKLLRHPHEKDPPSLLRGDAYFLAQLGEELARWVPSERRQVDADPPPIHLAMTVTTLSSEPHVFRDDLGTKIVEPVHRARFTFTDDHFATPRGLAAKLALAARATASFPGAFEPALIPVGGPLRRDGIDLPDMAGIASFGKTRWAIDGGVLVNQPVGPALEAIKGRSADGEIRRVLLYVNPDPGDVATAEDQPGGGADDPTAMPSLTNVVSKALVSLPRTESVAADLATITLHNHRLDRQRNTRTALLLGLSVGVRDADAGPSGPVLDLPALAGQLFPIWLRRRAFDSIQRRLQAQPGGYDPMAPVDGASYTWGQLEDELRAARGRIGWLASDFPDFGAALGERAGQWRYGLDPLEYLASVVLNVIGRTYALLPITVRDATRTSATRNQTLPDERERLGELRQLVHRQRALLQELRAVDGDYWCAALGRAPLAGETVAARAETLHTGWPLPTVPLASARSNAPAWRRARTWARAEALFAAANEHYARVADQAPLTDWDTAAEGVLTAPPAVDLDELQARLSGPDGIGRESLTTGYRRAELLIGRRLAELLADAAPLCYLAADRHLPSWRERVVAAWTAAADAADWNLPAVPNLVTDGSTAGTDAGRAAQLAAEVIRLTWSPITLDPPQPPQRRTWDDLLEELFALYVVHTMADHGLDDREVRIAFVQVSADSTSPLSPDGGAAAKVAGLQLGHFGGFLKRSWRANDWMWGALDGAAHLIAVLLDGERIRQRYLTARDAAAGLAAIAGGVDPSTGQRFPELSAEDQAYLAGLVDQPAIEAELARHWNSLSAPNLVRTTEALVRTAQLLIGRRELVSVGVAIRQSAHDQAAESARATELLGTLWPHLPPDLHDLRRPERAAPAPATAPTVPPPIPLDQVAHLVRTCPVAKERVAGEYGSDRMTATAAQAAAVTGNLVASDRLGIGPLRGPVRMARWGLLGLYYLAASAVTDTKTSAAFRNLLLAAGGVVLALAVFGIDIPGVLQVGALVAIAGWLALTVRSVRGWPALVGIAPVVLVLLLAAVLMLEPDVIGDTFSDRGDETWLGPALWAGVVVAAIGAVVEVVRGIIGSRRHLLHAVWWAVAAGLWVLAWWALFNGSYGGVRRWSLERLEDLHSVRIALLVAIPAALIGFELLRTWSVRRERERRRQRAGAGS